MFIQCGNGVRVLIRFNPSVLSFFHSETALTAITHLNPPPLPVVIQAHTGQTEQC